jgi:D-alanine--poly(phosphoribitol) ligase subunit 1
MSAVEARAGAAAPGALASSLGALFEQQVARRPDADALRGRGRPLSYRALDRAANRIGWQLRRSGAGEGTIVVLAMARSPAFIAALIGIVKVGAAYLPLDPSWPPERVRTVVEAARATLAVTDGEPLAYLPATITQLAVTVADGDGSGPDDASPAVPVGPDALAYVNFTSGSTGTPKGAMIPHHGVVSLLFEQDYMALNADVVTLQHSSPTFDATVFEIWAPLLHGGTCVVFDGAFPSVARLRAAIRDHGVNTIVLTTALFNVFIDTACDGLAPLRTVLTGGEAQSVRHWRIARERLPGVAIGNVYGPTETTVFVTHFPIQDLAADATSVPLGRAIGHREVFVARPDLTPAPPGEIGEICVAGAGLALGYAGRPDLTVERFVIAPGPTGVPRRIYRTGDLGRADATGSLEFLGRADQQVKLNGYRIELEEIERALTAHPEIRQAVVVVHGNEMTRKLKAVLVAPDLVRDGLVGFLARSLPPYMIPAALRTIDALPLTSSGKVDRAAVGKLFDEA